MDDHALSKDSMVMPMLMVISRLNHSLLDAKLKHLVSIIAVTGEVYDSHSAAVLIAFGAVAIHPYMLFQSVAMIEKRRDPNVDLAPILKKVRKAINAGLLKIMSKMGISTYPLTETLCCLIL